MDQILQISLLQNRRNKMADDGIKNPTRSNLSGRSGKSETTTASKAKKTHKTAV